MRAAAARRRARPLEWHAMPRRPPLPPGPFLIVGLARSGRALGPVLRALGEDVTGCDSGAADAAVLAELEAAGIAAHESTDGVELLDGVATVVKSPGVPQDAPVVRAARERGLLVLGELELGWRLVPNEVIAITGSNGKTTTAELVGQIHREAGLPVASPATSAPRSARWRASSTTPPSSSARRRRSSSRTRSSSRRRRPSCST